MTVGYSFFYTLKGISPILQEAGMLNNSLLGNNIIDLAAIFLKG